MAKKTPLTVWITVIDQKELTYGKVYLSPGERLSDLVNDDRLFIPVYADSNNSNRSNSKLQLINKNSIRIIREA